MAGLFRLFGPSDLAAAGYSLLGTLLGVPFLVLLAWQLGGRALACTAGLLYVLHPNALQLTISALTEPLSASLLLAAAYLLLQRDVRAHALAGAIFGLSYWNRTTLLLLALPAAGLLLWRAPARWRSLAWFSALAALGAGLWMAISFLLIGDPFFNLQTVTVLPFGAPGGPTDFPWYTFALPPSLPLSALLAKWLNQAVTVWELWPEALGPLYLLALALLGWVTCPRNASPLRWLVLSWLLLQVALYSLAGNITRFYVIFLPFVELFAASALLTFTRRWLGTSWVVPFAAGLIFLVALPSAGAITGWRPFEGSPSRQDALSAIVDVDLSAGPAIAARLPPDALVLSNVPWSVAWRAARPAAPLPPSPSGLADFERETGLRVRALYLTPQVYIVGMPAGWREWTLLRDRGDAPPGFRLERRFLHGGVLYLRVEPGSPPS
jgi:hypothetical protein